MILGCVVNCHGQLGNTWVQIHRQYNKCPVKLYFLITIATHWKKKKMGPSLKTLIADYFNGFTCLILSQSDIIRVAKKRLYFKTNMLLSYAGIFARDVFQVCKPHQRALKNPFTPSINYCSIIFRWLSHRATSPIICLSSFLLVNAHQKVIWGFVCLLFP